MKCSCLVIPRLWRPRCTCPHPDHPSQQPTSHESMKKVTVPARRIHNTSHQSTSVAACHMREKRWEGDKSEKGHSIVRTSTSIDQTKCWQCCSCEYVHTDHQHRRCASPRHVQPADHDPHPPPYEVESTTRSTNRSASQHVTRERRVGGSREGRKDGLSNNTLNKDFNDQTK